MIQYNNFLMKREQSRAGSRFAECEKSRLKAKILITLALLLTAVTGAWAQDANTVVWIDETWAGWAENVTTHTVGDITITATGSAKAYQHNSSGEPLAMEAGANDAITFTSNGKPFSSIAIQLAYGNTEIAGWTYNSSTYSLEWSGEPTTSVTLSGCYIQADVITFTFGTAEAPITVEPVEGKTNEWTFSMPGSDVVLTPQYAPVAKWVVEGEGDNAKTLLPTPAENIIAGTTDPIINEGTVATSTYGEGDGAKTIDQGTVMYAVTETNTTAPALTAYSDDVPTAAIVEGAVSEPTTRYVWYYIQGADTPAEEEATDKNTFNNSEVCATPLTVTLLPNVFNLVLKPTKANDITVEVNEVDKTLELIHNATENEDTLKAVKMQSDVKIKAKTGYKFKTIEVKKTVKLQSIKIDGITIYYAEGDTWITALQRDENKNCGAYIEGGYVWSNAGILCDSDDAPVSADVEIKATESYSFQC